MSFSGAVHLTPEEVISIVKRPPSVGEGVGAGVGEVVGAGVGEVVGAGVGEVAKGRVVSSTTTIVDTAAKHAKATRYLRDFAGGCWPSNANSVPGFTLCDGFKCTLLLRAM